MQKIDVKYILDIGKLRKGDIILDRENTAESQKIREKTHANYSHARLYVGGTVMEANGMGVQSVNPQRILYDHPDDAIVLRCKNASQEQLHAACLFARSEFAKEYGLSRSDNAQYCFRLVAEAFQYAGLNVVKIPKICNANDFINSVELEEVGNMVREARQQELDIALGEGVMQDKGHYNEQTKTAADMFEQIRNYVRTQGSNADSIQDDDRLFVFLKDNPQYDAGIAGILSASPYFFLWEKHEETHPWEFDADLLRKKFGSQAIVAAQQILNSCEEENVYVWQHMLATFDYIYTQYRLESARVYYRLYDSLLRMTARRAQVAKIVLGL